MSEKQSVDIKRLRYGLQFVDSPVYHPEFAQAIDELADLRQQVEQGKIREEKDSEQIAGLLRDLEGVPRIPGLEQQVADLKVENERLQAENNRWQKAELPAVIKDRDNIRTDLAAAQAKLAQAEAEGAGMRQALGPLARFYSWIIAAIENGYIKRFDPDCIIASLSVAGGSDYIWFRDLEEAHKALSTNLGQRVQAVVEAVGEWHESTDPLAEMSLALKIHVAYQRYKGGWKNG